MDCDCRAVPKLKLKHVNYLKLKVEIRHILRHKGLEGFHRSMADARRGSQFPHGWVHTLGCQSILIKFELL